MSGHYKHKGVLCLVPGLLRIAVLCLCLGCPAAGYTESSDQVRLSPEEKEWLAAHKEIKMAIRDNPPLMMRGAASGAFSGLTIDYLHILEDRLGIKFRMVWYSSQKMQLERAKSREVDVTAAAVWSEERLAWFNFTPPYIVLDNKIIAREGAISGPVTLDELSGKRVGVVEGTAVSVYLAKYSNLFTIVPMVSEPALLESVSLGSVDAAVLDMARGSYYIQMGKINNLAVVGDVSFSYKFCFASRKDLPVLNSILSKGLASISEEERQAIFRKWIYPHTPSMLRSEMFWISVTGSGMAVFSIMLLFWNRTLRRRIQDSNAELLILNEQLRQSQKMEAVGQLAGGIAHDFNNILMAIMGYGDLLRMKITEDNVLRKNVEHIIEAANRAAHLTHDLLKFSRRQVLNPEAIDLNEIVERIEALLRRGIGEKVDLRITFSGEILVYADRSQIELVLINLANNARDAMPDGGILSINISSAAVDAEFKRRHGFGEAGAYALVTITDTGIGMDEKTRMRIFEPFFTTKEVGKGTGLGLSMVYGIVKQHHGYINVESEPGKGTIFSIYLPKMPADTKKTKLPEFVHEEKLSGGSETLLVAEDDEAVRRLTCGLLEEAGYSIIEAVNGDDAIKKYSEYGNEIHLLILDMIMPGKGGLEALGEIRKMRPDARAIFVSGYSADKIYMDRMKVSESELVAKPISSGNLLRKVREILDKQQRGE
jgi:signal transduction histidine kinase/ActR/RegA family two-component response regulator